jgi:lysophospholipase L1-like esterase
MSRAGRARDIAARAAYGGGGLAAAGLAGVAVIKAEVQIARRLIGDGPGVSQDDNGTYGAGVGEPLRLLVLGDSTASGVGADSPRDTIGATVATGIAALTGRPVHLRNASRSGSTSVSLPAQVERGLELLPDAQVALVMIGTNDVKDRLDEAESVRCLGQAVTTLRAAGVEVVVGTCPDLGTIRPVPQPLRWLAQRWSRDLAAAQTVAVVEAGGRTVSLGDLLGPDFHTLHEELFSSDRFHPSSAGYARAAAVVLPSILDALGLVTADSGRAPDYRRGESVQPLAAAAQDAVDEPGSEVSQAEVDGHTRSARGRWAQLLRRQRPAPGAVVGEPPAAPETSQTGPAAQPEAQA